MKSVCIVGAGPAGLVAAKVLTRSHFQVTVYEKADRIGGIWALDSADIKSPLASDTPTNLSRFTVGFSDLDWNSVVIEASFGKPTHSQVPMFPQARHVNRYLETYMEKFIPRNTVQVGVEVVRVERLQRAGKHRWKIFTRDRHALDETAEYDFLLLATGFFSMPRPPTYTIDGSSLESNVRMIHSSHFRRLSDLFVDPEHAAGKTILIVGGGNSAGEVAAAIANQVSNAKHSPEAGPDRPFANCKIVHVTPRPLYAVPPFLPRDESGTTFVPLDFKLYDLSKRPPGPICGNAGLLPKAAKDMVHTMLQSALGGDQSDLGPALTVPSSEPRSAVYVALSESYSEFVRSGVISVVQGRVHELRMTSQTSASAHLLSGANVSGTIDNVGAVVYATGYSPASALQLLPQDVKDELQYDPDSMRLPLILQDWQTSVAALPELALLGFYEGPYWPIVEMQARLTAQKWSGDCSSSPRRYEETAQLLHLRHAMQDRHPDVPQYWFGDFAGYMEEMSSYLDLQRNDVLFAEREGCVSPARYMCTDTDKENAVAIMTDLHQVWQDCAEQGKYVARAVFRAMHGNWNMSRRIDSALPSLPSGTVDVEASFHPRCVTKDPSGRSFDFEYLYTERGMFTLVNGSSMPVQRRYVYRYSEERDELSSWFVKPDNDLEVDYLFHNLLFESPAATKAEAECVAKCDHPCVDDMYYTTYRFPMKGVSLHNFQVQHLVKGPGKDYVAATTYSRPSK